MKWTLATALVVALALAGCGNKQGPDSNDARTRALYCLTTEHGLDARPSGTDAIEVGNARTGPRVQFFLTRGQAEAAQIQGTAEGSIQSGSALIFVRRNGDQILQKVEDCIDNL